MDDPQIIENRWLFLNDWPLRRFNVIVLGFLLCLTSLLTGRALVGDGPLFNYLGYLMVLFLIFIPGSILLRIMRVHGLDFTRSMLYALPLGVAYIIGFGFALNLLHYGGLVYDPLSFNVLALAYPLSILCLLVLAIWRDKGYQAPIVKHPVDPIFIMMAVLSFAIPFLVVCGAFIADFNGPRVFMFYVLLALCMVPLLLLSHRTKHYEFIILSLSIALLFQKALLTDYLQGYDIFSELSAATVTTNIGWWDILKSNGLLGGGANTALSIVTLAPVLSNLTSIQPMVLLKIIYPFIFAFVPLMIYKIIEGQFNARVAILGSLLFISYAGFFNLMTQLGKQEIAELFLVAAILVLLDVSLSRGTRRLMLGVFLAGVVVSHYTLGYMLMAIIAGMVVLQALAFIARSWKGRERGQGSSLFKWMSGTGRSWLRTEVHERILTLDLLILIVALFYIWYSIAAGGFMLKVIDSSQEYIIPSGYGSSSLRSLEAIQYLLIDYGSTLHNMEKYFVLGTQMVTIFGVAFLLAFRKEGGPRLKDEFLFLGIGGSGILIASYIVPNLALSFYFGRFFQFTLIFLCGFFAIGIYGFYFLVREWIRNGFGKERSGKKWDLKRITFTTGVLLISFFLMFNTNVLFPMVGQYSNSFALDRSVSGSIYSDSDVTTALYLSDDAHLKGRSVMVDYHRFPIFAGEGIAVKNLPYQIHPTDTDNFIFLSSWNNEYGYAYPLNTNGSVTLSYCSLGEVFKQVNGTYDVLYSSSGGATAIYIAPNPPNTNPVGPPIYTYENAPIYVIPAMVLFAVSVFVLALAAQFNYHRKKAKEKDI